MRREGVRGCVIGGDVRKGGVRGKCEERCGRWRCERGKCEKGRCEKRRCERRKYEEGN